MKASFTFSLSAPPPASRKFAGRAAAELDHVERRHRQAGAVHHAADVPVEPHVGEVDLLGLALARVLLVGIAQLRDVGVPVERVVVEVELGVERDAARRPW